MTAANITPIHGPELDIQIETISPDVARRYLGYNTHNRNIRQGRIDAYADDMRNGRWTMNGEAIKFAHDGTLQDGQHRLYAVIASGMTITMLVIRGLPAESQDTMDTGASRKLSDILSLRGEKSAIFLAAAIRGVHLWSIGRRRFTGGQSASNATLLAFFDDNLWIRDASADMQRIALHSKLPAGVVGALYKAFNDIDAADAEYFFARLSSDTGHEQGDPIYSLRRALLASKDDTKGTRNPTYLAAITCKAWNKFRDGEEVKLIGWRPGGANPEAFPEPK